MAKEEANIIHGISGAVGIGGAGIEFLREKEFETFCGSDQVIRSGSSGGGGSLLARVL